MADTSPRSALDPDELKATATESAPKPTRPYQVYSNVSDANAFCRQFNKYKRKIPAKELTRFYARYLVDGISALIVYRKGRLALAVQGECNFDGEDLSQVFAAVSNVPQRFKSAPLTVVRGVLTIHRGDFYTLSQRVIAEGDTGYDKVEDAVLDLIQKSTDDVFCCRILRFYAHGVTVVSEPEWDTDQQFTHLHNLGFNTPRSGTCLTPDELRIFISHGSQARKETPYFVHGIRVQLNSCAIRHEIEEKNTGECAIVGADWSLDSSGVSSTIETIEWRIDRDWCLSPWATISPTVYLEGDEISQIPLHSAHYMRDHRIVEGCEVTLDRSGDSGIALNNFQYPEGTGDPVIPETCPYCNSPLVEYHGKLYCSNFDCAGALEAATRYAFGLLSFQKLTDEQIHELFTSRTIGRMYDLFIPCVSRSKTIPQMVLDDLVKATRELNLLEVIMLLGIPGLGRAAASKMASEAGGLKNLVDLMKSPERLGYLQFRSSAIETIVHWAEDPAHSDFLLALYELKLPYCGK